MHSYPSGPYFEVVITVYLIRTFGATATTGGRWEALSIGANYGIEELLMEAKGDVVSRSEVLEVLPGDSRSGHAVEVAVGRLREAIGDRRVVQTVVKRGYRLALA